MSCRTCLCLPIKFASTDAEKHRQNIQKLHLIVRTFQKEYLSTAADTYAHASESLDSLIGNERTELDRTIKTALANVPALPSEAAVLRQQELGPRHLCLEKIFIETTFHYIYRLYPTVSTASSIRLL